LTTSIVRSRDDDADIDKTAQIFVGGEAVWAALTRKAASSVIDPSRLPSLAGEAALGMPMSRTCFFVLPLLLVVGQAMAGDAPAPQQCWTPQALAGTDAELKHGSSHKAVDLAALKQVMLLPATPVAPELRGSIRGVTLPPGEKLIALTFDLCEENGYVSGYDGRVVDLLRTQGIKATFFAGGKWLETHPERAQQLIADPLFEIGSHGLRHLDLSRTNDPTLSEEIVLTEAAYARARSALTSRQCFADTTQRQTPPEQMTLFRFPYGRCNDKALKAVADAGLVAIQWDVVTGDPDPHVSAKTIANTILSKAHPGAIVVAHANGRGRNTAAALALALPKLKEQGYNFVTVSELLKAGKPMIATRCYQNTPGDRTRIARTTARRGSHDLFSIFGGSN
jgi:peptidoglycan/xylan/chitin deacetylase (PgdA/CDA1 family)